MGVISLWNRLGVPLFVSPFVLMYLAQQHNFWAYVFVLDFFAFIVLGLLALGASFGQRGAVYKLLRYCFGYLNSLLESIEDIRQTVIGNIVVNAFVLILSFLVGIGFWYHFSLRKFLTSMWELICSVIQSFFDAPVLVEKLRTVLNSAFVGYFYQIATNMFDEVVKSSQQGDPFPVLAAITGVVIFFGLCLFIIGLVVRSQKSSVARSASPRRRAE